VEEATKKLEAHPEYQRLQKLYKQKVQPIFSYDGARHHTSNRLMAFLPAGYDTADNFPLPPYSPDIHRVIEHAHGRATSEFQKWVYSNNMPGLTVDDYKREFESIYMKCCSAEVINADVEGLPELFDNIIENEGGWADAKYR
jgi:hypothetical protein